MRGLRRNFTPFYYANLSSKTAVTDANGNRTGEWTLNYGNVALVKGNVSASRGNAELEQFGINLHYTKSIYVDNFDCPIEEDSKLWLGFGIIDTYSTSTSYTAGTLTIYSGKIYMANKATTGTWASADWDEVPYNFAVVGVAKALKDGGVVYAVKEVDKS